MVISGYRNHGKRLRFSLKPDKSKSSFEVKDLAPQKDFWKRKIPGSWCTYLIRSWAENMKSLWKHNAKRKKRKITLRFQRLFMFLVQLFLKYQYIFPENLIFHFLLWGKKSVSSLKIPPFLSFLYTAPGKGIKVGNGTISCSPHTYYVIGNERTPIDAHCI